MCGKGNVSWDYAVHVQPTPAAVLKLVESHGLDAAYERWHWLSPRTIYNRYMTAKRARARIEAQRHGS